MAALAEQNARPRVLCLHGMHASTAAFLPEARVLMGDLPVDCDGPDHDGMWWWPSLDHVRPDPRGALGWETSAAALAPALDAHDAVLGFSQGAAMAAVLCALLRAAPEVAGEVRHADGSVTAPQGQVTIFRLAPGAHVLPHVGVTNRRLVLQMPLQGWQGVRFRVGDEWRAYAEGRAMVFDDSFEHEVVHSGEQPRFVLECATVERGDGQGGQRGRILLLGGEEAVGVDEARRLRRVQPPELRRAHERRACLLYTSPSPRDRG